MSKQATKEPISLNVDRLSLGDVKGGLNGKTLSRYEKIILAEKLSTAAENLRKEDTASSEDRKDHSFKAPPASSSDSDSETYSGESSYNEESSDSDESKTEELTSDSESESESETEMKGQEKAKGIKIASNGRQHELLQKYGDVDAVHGDAIAKKEEKRAALSGEEGDGKKKKGFFSKARKGFSRHVVGRQKGHNTMMVETAGGVYQCSLGKKDAKGYYNLKCKKQGAFRYNDSDAKKMLKELEKHDTHSTHLERRQNRALEAEGVNTRISDDAATTPDDPEASGEEVPQGEPIGSFLGDVWNGARKLVKKEPYFQKVSGTLSKTWDLSDMKYLDSQPFIPKEVAPYLGAADYTDCNVTVDAIKGSSFVRVDDLTGPRVVDHGFYFANKGCTVVRNAVYRIHESDFSKKLAVDPSISYMITIDLSVSGFSPMGFKGILSPKTSDVGQTVVYYLYSDTGIKKELRLYANVYTNDETDGSVGRFYIVLGKMYVMTPVPKSIADNLSKQMINEKGY